MTRALSIVTPEHVSIRLEPAGAGSRFLALMIDSMITTGIASLIASLSGALFPRGVVGAIFVTVNFVLTWGWHVYFETRRQGRTPGKRALRLRVIDARGLPLTLYQSFVRNVTRAVDFLPLFYGLGATAGLIHPHRRRLGDLVADTLVIRESQPLVDRGAVAAARRHNTLRSPRILRAIRHRISLEEREFLLSLCLRASKMAPAARYDLMEDVAAMYRAKLGIEDGEPISGENLVRDLTALLYAQ